MKIGIGIDTGGTCTDAVLYDFDNRQVLSTAKALTTREDLTVGILNALDQLPLDLLRQAELLALSTTLATNACVEDRTGRAKLIFFGGEEVIVDRFGGAYGLPPAEDIWLVDCPAGRAAEGVDWDAFRGRVAQADWDGLDGVGIVELNARKNGAVVEKTARDILLAHCPELPVVCGHELFSGLNSLQRCAGTLLNAGLFPVIAQFLKAIRRAMDARGIHAQVVVVRSDGSLMSEEFASAHPVETLLCGPAASVLGGWALAPEPNCVVVDMGGTTTDLALIKDGVPVTELDGVRIGRWKTFVDGLVVRTFGLGGDTAVHYHGEQMILEDYRVMPLSILASRYPQVEANLLALKNSKIKHTRFLHEHYLLTRDIRGQSRYTDREQALCAALAAGPLSLRQLAGALDTDVYSLGAEHLVREGVVQVCGLTPTDIMHLKGDFTAYSTTAAASAAAYVARNLGIDVDTLCDRVYDAVERRMYHGIVHLLLEDQRGRRAPQGEEVEKLLDWSYDAAGQQQGSLIPQFTTSFTLLGIGAPTHIFLPRVAARLGTRAVIPEHSQVANALGAVVGDVAASCTVEIRPTGSEGPAGYTVYAPEGRRYFREEAEAEQYALEQAETAARAEVALRGGQGHIAVTSHLERQEAGARDCTVHLGTLAHARAVGTVGCRLEKSE